MSPWAFGLLLSAWAATTVGASPVTPRLAALRLEPAGSPRAVPGPADGGRDDAPPTRAGLVLALDVSVALLVASVVPGALGLVLAAGAVGAAHRWLSGLPARARRHELSDARRALPLVLELVSAALAAGSTTETAVGLAADAAPAGVADVLREVVAGLRLGAPADEAWRPALALDGFDRLARAAVRSAASGAALRAACSELARRERRLRHLEAQAAVKRAGVWAVLPLAVCYLPAFVLLGVVPVVVGLLQSVAL